MKKTQHITTYKLYHPSISDDFKIVGMSDLHFSVKVSDAKMECLYERLLEMNPNYLLIAGDLIDSSAIEEIEKTRLLRWLEKLSHLCTICISIGNHEFYKYEKYRDTDGKKHKSKPYFNSNFFHKISNIPNIYVLNNDSYENDNFYVAGITLPYDYYKATPSYHGEHKEILMETLKSERKLLANLPKDKVKLAMIHSPIYLQDKDVKEELVEFDYLLAGHMHNGCVIPGLYEIWNTSYGLISPHKTPFPKNARNTLKTKEDKLIVNGALVTFQECTKYMQAFNVLFPMYLTELDFTNDKSYNTEVVYKKTRYRR